MLAAWTHAPQCPVLLVRLLQHGRSIEADIADECSERPPVARVRLLPQCLERTGRHAIAGASPTVSRTAITISRAAPRWVHGEFSEA